MRGETVARPVVTLARWLAAWDGPALVAGTPPWRNPADTWDLDKQDVEATRCRWCGAGVRYAAYHNADWRHGERVYVALAVCPACGSVEAV